MDKKLRDANGAQARTFSRCHCYRFDLSSFRSTGRFRIRIRQGNEVAESMPLEGMPPGFCRVYLQPDYPIHPAPTEYYLPQTADIAAAAAIVHYALNNVSQNNTE